jgi:hypothetical protein
VGFDEAIGIIEGLSGEEVEASVWGKGEEAVPVAFMSGVLRRRTRDDDLDVSKLGEESVTFVFGVDQTTELVLWRSRFLRATRTETRRLELELTTQDAVIWIGPRSRPWID